VGGQGEAGAALGFSHARGELALLGQRGGGVGGWQQTGMPSLVVVQALGRGVHLQRLVGLPLTGCATGGAQLDEQVLQLGQRGVGLGQVVRPQRAGQAMHLAALAVAAGLQVPLDHGHVHPAGAQVARGGQAGHAGAHHQHLGLALSDFARGRCGAQCVRAGGVGAQPSNVQRRCGWRTSAQPQHGRPGQG
jgi:hypothetical protein